MWGREYLPGKALPTLKYCLPETHSQKLLPFRERLSKLGIVRHVNGHKSCFAGEQLTALSNEAGFFSKKNISRAFAKRGAMFC